MGDRVTTTATRWNGDTLHVSRSQRPVSLTEAAPQGMAAFTTLAARYEFVAAQAAKGANYFVGFINATPEHPDHRYGLSYGRADWVTGGLHMKDLGGLIH